MKLTLPFAAHHAVTATPGGAVAELAPGVSLTVHPVQPLPFDVLEWRNGVLQAGLPDGAVVKLLAEELGATQGTGWPVALFVSDVTRGEVVLERRLHAFYQLTQYGAVAVLRGSAEALKGFAAEARALFLGAVPDWRSDQVATVEQIWEGF